MSFTAGDVASRASIILNDEDYTRWTLAELMGWLNDGAKETVIRRPAAHASVSTLTLAAGDSQEIPAGGIQLLDVICNVSGGTRGRAVTLVSARLLDDQEPGWRSGAQQASIYHFAYDERAPRRFTVYPPATAGIQVEAKYSSAPATVAAAVDVVDLPDEYLPALVSYLLYRAYAKDSEFANGVMAASHFQAFESALGLNTQTTAANSPRGTTK